jgi:hypothetical protein
MSYDYSGAQAGKAMEAQAADVSPLEQNIGRLHESANEVQDAAKSLYLIADRILGVPPPTAEKPGSALNAVSAPSLLGKFEEAHRHMAEARHMLNRAVERLRSI